MVRVYLAGPFRLSRKVSPLLEVSPRTKESTEPPVVEEEAARVTCQALSSFTWSG